MSPLLVNPLENVRKLCDSNPSNNNFEEAVFVNVPVNELGLECTITVSVLFRFAEMVLLPDNLIFLVLLIIACLVFDRKFYIK